MPARARARAYGEGRLAIANAARSLFYLKGLRTGLDEVLAAAQVTKPTFYHHYSGRAALEQEYLSAQAGDLWLTMERIASRARSPRQLIRRWMEYVRKRSRADSYRGCPLGNFAIEASEEHREQVAGVFEESVAHLQAALVTSGMAPRRAAEIVWGLFTIYQGGFLMTRATQDPVHLSRAAKMMEALVI